eukprot:1439368-Rhodomonas_salina.1
MELDERTENAINEELSKWNQYEEAAHLAEQMSKIESNAGTGKTFVAEALLHYARSKMMIAKESAVTWLAAGNFSDALSIHSLLGLGIEEGIDAQPCSRSFSREAVLKHARFIVLDELPFLKRETFEQISTYLRDLKQEYPLGLLVVMACGDFRQLAPVMQGNPPPAQDNTDYGAFVQAIGDGQVSERRYQVGTPEHLASINELYVSDLSQIHLDNMKRSEFVGFPNHAFLNNEHDFILRIFPDLNGAEESLSALRAILCSTNKQKEKWNQLVQLFQTAPSL